MERMDCLVANLPRNDAAPHRAGRCHAARRERVPAQAGEREVLGELGGDAGAPAIVIPDATTAYQLTRVGR